MSRKAFNAASLGARYAGYAIYLIPTLVVYYLYPCTDNCETLEWYQNWQNHIFIGALGCYIDWKWRTASRQKEQKEKSK